MSAGKVNNAREEKKKCICCAIMILQGLKII